MQLKRKINFSENQFKIENLQYKIINHYSFNNDTIFF